MERPNNAFLQGLTEGGFGRLSESLKLVDLELGRVLYHQGNEIEWVYFPVGCLISLICTDQEGESVETAMVGNEGAANLVEACGSGVSSVESVVQVDGRAWRIPASTCRKLALSDPEFSAGAWRLTELQLAESRQSALCQAMHPVEARFSRWLLESLDRSDRRNPLPLTQEFVAAMLGVQRTTVSAFASQLQKEGLITYSRGRLQIDDEKLLEGRACGCRQVSKDQRQRLGLSVTQRA